ncbi:ATP-binding cassette domain-containing protein [Hymenobacter oligotrophus]|uniref:ATP-binding cassette domain-containing protein n=1 Tax=Hymenobacter oligotrophus TaxID=2319843 RepID=A0A3B7RQP8_9BACT|nr:ATP-binding cassette domain-containing protein [Hymenobacter oligotrophus]AYA36497.1 ATP-binding cassette domain-containing protein [Hymenobacter oligotrophus]
MVAESVLELQQLSKRYGRTKAVQDLTLSVPRGSVYGLLGPNGSGKTTTLGIALGVLHATAGTVRWFGQAPSATARRRIGALLETPNFFPYLSARQNLQIAADIKGADEAAIQAALQTVELANRQHEPVRGFSLGMKQRLALASALLGQPEVLVLDEPTNGLDPTGIADVRALIQRLAAQGKTIILASHLLDEVQKVCTHVGVMHQGQLRAAGAVSAILAATDRVHLRLGAEAAPGVLAQALAALPFVHDVQTLANGACSLALASGHSAADVNRALFAQGLALAHLSTEQRSLEAEFLQIIQKS